MCIFCEIAAHRVPAEIVMENEHFMAFNDINPVAPVHVLIIPKRHIPDFNQIEAGEMGNMDLFIQKVARELGLDKSGYRLVTNIGNHGGQEVMHLHWHLLGGGKLLWGSKRK